MSDFLRDMAASSAGRAAVVGAREVRARAADHLPVPLAVGDFTVIAEVKLRAPSVGRLATPADPSAAAADRARRYADAGADAISVLTEPSRFDGDLAHLAAAAAVSSAPVMRKDFLVDPIQVWEARASGASGVLLIATMLDDDALARCLDAATAAGLFVLLEGFTRADLVRMTVVADSWRGAQPLLLGLNCRDLRTLQIDPPRFAALADAFPEGGVAIAESGVHTADDARAVRTLGYRGVLVGTALMRAADPGALVASLRKA